MDTKVYEEISLKHLYKRTGIQKQIFNTIYQLMAVKQQEPQLFEQAENMLMIPDYFNFLLTGVKKTEYTNATTTQLLNPKTNDWDFDLIKRLGYPERIFGEISDPGTIVGDFSKEIEEEVDEEEETDDFDSIDSDDDDIDSGDDDLKDLVVLDEDEIEAE